MIKCFSRDRKRKESNSKDDEMHNKKFSYNEDISNLDESHLKKMSEDELNKLKINLNIKYKSILCENQITNDKIALYKKIIEEYKKNVKEETDDNLMKFMEVRNSILDKEITELKNKYNTLNKEYLSLFDSVSSLYGPNSELNKLSDRIYILENKIKEQENILKFLEEKCEDYSDESKIQEKIIFLDLFEYKGEKESPKQSGGVTSESPSSSSSSSSKESVETINSMTNFVGDIKETNKFIPHNSIPKEKLDDYKRLLGTIYKNNYEQVTKEYQKVLTTAQTEILSKNTNLKKLEIIKNEIEMVKDPSKKLKMMNEREKNINNSKEIEKKNDSKKLKQLYYDKKIEYEELLKNYDNLNNELKKEEEEFESLQNSINEKSEILKEKIQEGNDIETELEEIKKQRDEALLEKFGHIENNNDSNIIDNDDS